MVLCNACGTCWSRHGTLRDPFNPRQNSPSKSQRKPAARKPAARKQRRSRLGPRFGEEPYDSEDSGDEMPPGWEEEGAGDDAALGQDGVDAGGVQEEPSGGAEGLGGGAEDAEQQEQQQQEHVMGVGRLGRQAGCGRIDPGRLVTQALLQAGMAIWQPGAAAMEGQVAQRVSGCWVWVGGRGARHRGMGLVWQLQYRQGGCASGGVEQYLTCTATAACTGVSIGYKQGI
jgi:hypothetical protein